MALDDFFSDEAKAQVRAAIEHVEAQTSAELVVAVRRQADPYREALWLMGAAMAFATLLCLLFLPVDFAVHTMPFDVVLGFGLGVFLAWRSPSLRRRLVSSAAREAQVRRVACEVFVSRGVGKTSARNGILVFVSALEKRVECVADVGLDVTVLGPAWQSSLQRAQAAVEQESLPDFVAALKALGPTLGAVMPRQADDVNELSDEVGT